MDVIRKTVKTKDTEQNGYVKYFLASRTSCFLGMYCYEIW